MAQEEEEDHCYTQSDLWECCSYCNKRALPAQGCDRCIIRCKTSRDSTDKMVCTQERWLCPDCKRTLAQLQADYTACRAQLTEIKQSTNLQIAALQESIKPQIDALRQSVKPKLAEIAASMRTLVSRQRELQAVVYDQRRTLQHEHRHAKARVRELERQLKHV